MDEARASRGRRVLTWALIVAASLIAIASVLSTWVDRQMLDQQSWRKASAELIEDPAVQQTLSLGVAALRRQTLSEFPGADGVPVSPPPSRIGSHDLDRAIR